MKIITLASTKGGVGKSTTTCLLADGFLRSGARVRVIDLDPQQSTHRWAASAAESNEHLTVSTIEVQPADEMADIYNRILEALEDAPDWVLIDTQGSDCNENLAALAMADLVVVPSGPIADEVQGVAKTLHYMQKAFETAEIEGKPEDHFRVLYQAPAQFPDETMLEFKEVIFQHFGAFDAPPRSSAAASLIGTELTSDELMADYQARKKNTKSLKTLQERTDALIKTLKEQLDG